METSIILSFLIGGIVGAVVFALIFVHVIIVPWESKTEVSDYMKKRNLLLTMQDEIIRGGFMKVESNENKHSGRLFIIKL